MVHVVTNPFILRSMKTIFSLLLSALLCSTIKAQVPQLNSLPGASAVVYLDFDGQYVAGTAWNFSGPFTALPAALNTAAITEIFNRVAEDFRIFNLNITTDSTVFEAAPASQRMRIIITPTYEWWGAAGGVSYVGSFTWGNDTPAWVFSGLLTNSPKKIAEAASHEAGHTLGLQHQSSYDASCNRTAEYSSGKGTGEISWAPIMGVGYSRNLTTWYNGPNLFGCSYLQNDIEIIAGPANNFGLRSDEHADQYNLSSPVSSNGSGFEASGLINSSADKDVFSFTVATANSFQLNAIPQNVGAGNSGANVDIRVSLLNASGDTINRYNPSDLLDAGVDTLLNPSIYYLVVEGVGNTNLTDYGSVGYYTIQGSLTGVLAVNKLKLTGNLNASKHQLNWQIETDETILHLEIESSTDGVNFELLSKLPAQSRSFSWQPIQAKTTWYRIRLISASGGKQYYSNAIALKPAANAPIKLAGNSVSDRILVDATGNYSYQLFSRNGALVKSGNLTSGRNILPVSGLANGLLLLRVFNGTETTTYKLIKQ